MFSLLCMFSSIFCDNKCLPELRFSMCVLFARTNNNGNTILYLYRVAQLVIRITNCVLSMRVICRNYRVIPVWFVCVCVVCRNFVYVCSVCWNYVLSMCLSFRDCILSVYVSFDGTMFCLFVCCLPELRDVFVFVPWSFCIDTFALEQSTLNPVYVFPVITIKRESYLNSCFKTCTCLLSFCISKYIPIHIFRLNVLH